MGLATRLHVTPGMVCTSLVSVICDSWNALMLA